MEGEVGAVQPFLARRTATETYVFYTVYIYICNEYKYIHIYRDHISHIVQYVLFIYVCCSTVSILVQALLSLVSASRMLPE